MANQKVTVELNELEEKLKKKRDEVQKILEEFEPIIESAQRSEEELDLAIQHIQAAKEAVGDAGDILSEYV